MRPVLSSDGETVGTVHRVFVGDDQRVTPHCHFTRIVLHGLKNSFRLHGF